MEHAQCLKVGDGDDKENLAYHLNGSEQWALGPPLHIEAVQVCLLPFSWSDVPLGTRRRVLPLGITAS